ncbi:MAG: glycosyltransferase [Pseudomonadota bacterium]
MITNLFGFPWDASRGVFNQQQFDRLAERVDLSVLVAVPWPQALRRPGRYWTARREGRKRWAYVDYFVFWYVPGVAQALHSLFFFASLVLQRPALLFFTRWQALLGSWGFPDAVATAAVGAMTRTPVLMKVHGTDVNDYLDVPGKRWQILAAARRCHAVMAPSMALRTRLIDAGVAGHSVHVVYNGVDATRFQPGDRRGARARLGLDAETQTLLFVGNLKVAKGCVELIEAFVTLAPTHPTLGLAIVGDGEARTTLARLAAEAGLTERVRFVGKADHAILPVWFAASDVLCLPSHNEGVPNVVLEAMACGVPVVATRVGGIPEVVPDYAGVLVPVRDNTSLVAALESALTRQWDRERISSHAHGFAWDANVDRVTALLAGAAGHPPAP